MPEVRHHLTILEDDGLGMAQQSGDGLLLVDGPGGEDEQKEEYER